MISPMSLIAPSATADTGTCWDGKLPFEVAGPKLQVIFLRYRDACSVLLNSSMHSMLLFFWQHPMLLLLVIGRSSEVGQPAAPRRRRDAVAADQRQDVFGRL